MELYLEGTEPTEGQLIAAIRRATIANRLNPVLCGSAFKNKGVQPMLDAVVRYLPSPLDVDAIEGHAVGTEEQVLSRKPSEGEPFSALAFKIMSDPHLGKLTYIRVYSGALEAGTQVLNSTKDRKERIGKIYKMHANKREEIDRVGAGHIVAVMGLKDTTTGDTLSDVERADHPGVDELPGPGHPRRHRAEDQERPGEAGHRDPAARRGGPDLPGPHRRGDRPDDHRRHGRAAPRRPRRPDAPRVQGRRQRRQAAGGLPRDDHQGRRQGRVHAQEADRRLRPVRPRHHRHRADRWRGRRRLRVRQQGHRWPHPARVHPVGRRGLPGGHGVRRPGRLPARRRQGDAARRRSTTTSTPPSSRSRSPARWPSRRPPARPARCSWSR